jgi:hypothetical protein
LQEAVIGKTLPGYPIGAFISASLAFFSAKKPVERPNSEEKSYGFSRGKA